MVAILGLGLSAHALVDEGERVGVLPDVTDYDDIHKLADALDTPGDGPTIAIVPTWIDEAAFMRLRTAHSLLPERHLAVHRTSLPPLAAAGVAALVSALGTRLAPGVLAAAAPALDGEVRAYAWLGSVRSLTRPKPSFGQRLRSSWPGSAFAASVSPPWVRNAKDPAAVPERLAHPTRLAYAAVGQAERGWVTSPDGGHRPQRPHDGPGLRPAWQPRGHRGPRAPALPPDTRLQRPQRPCAGD